MLTLAANVHLRHPDTGKEHVLRPGEEVPDWAVGLITNRAAWPGGVLPVVPAEEDEADAGGEESAGEGGQQVPPAGDPDDPLRTPRGNASRAAWVAHAAALGVVHDPDADREAIKAAIAAASTQS